MSNKKVSTTQKLEILREIEDYFIEHEILMSPFLEKLRNGKLVEEQIKLWISQQFYFSMQFPRCIAALYSRIEDFAVSKPLMNFLNIEHWGSENNSAHWKMFKIVLEYFGLDLEKLKETVPFKETQTYLDYRLKLCLNSTIEEGLGALGFGHEFINEKIFESYLMGIKQLKTVPEEVLCYFKAHVEDEPEDYQVFKNIIISYCNTFDSFELIKKGADDVVRERTHFFKNILRRLDNSYNLTQIPQENSIL